VAICGRGSLALVSDKICEDDCLSTGVTAGGIVGRSSHGIIKSE
jgi:hypothetical protein